MNSTRRLTDIVLFFSFCFLAGSGIMLKFSFVKGMGPQNVLGMAKPEWCTLHLIVGGLMIAALVVHLILNRVWIEKIAAMNRKWLAIAAIALGIAMSAALALWPTTYENPPQTAQSPSHGGGMGQGHAYGRQ